MEKDAFRNLSKKYSHYEVAPCTLSRNLAFSARHSKRGKLMFIRNIGRNKRASVPRNAKHLHLRCAPSKAAWAFVGTIAPGSLTRRLATVAVASAMIGGLGCAAAISAPTSVKPASSEVHAVKFSPATERA